jgi:hypothetical protein
MLPAIPVKMTRRMRSASSSVSSVVSKNPEGFSLRTKYFLRGPQAP